MDELWFTRCPVPTATGIAADRGRLTEEFAADGITVRSLQDVPPELAADHHYTHGLTGLFREGGNVPALWARARGEATRVVGLTWIEEPQSILVRADSELRTPVRPGLLIGLTVGLTLGVVTGFSRLGEELLDSSLQLLRTIPFLSLVRTAAR